MTIRYVTAAGVLLGSSQLLAEASRGRTIDPMSCYMADGVAGITTMCVVGVVVTFVMGIALGYAYRGRTASKKDPDSNPGSKPYNDAPLCQELAGVKEVLAKFAVNISDLSKKIDGLKIQPAPVQEAQPKQSAPVARSSPSNGMAEVVAAYRRSRSSRDSWSEFEERYSCERFSCANVPEWMARPETQLRFQSSTGGVYLAVPSNPGKFLVFPFFSANPKQLMRDGAMSEVFAFPASSDGVPQVTEPAVFTRSGDQWFLQSKGRLEEGL